MEVVPTMKSESLSAVQRLVVERHDLGQRQYSLNKINAITAIEEVTHFSVNQIYLTVDYCRNFQICYYIILLTLWLCVYVGKLVQMTTL